MSEKYKKVDLGDGVYAEFDGDYVVLTTEDGPDTTNKIYFNAETRAALEKYLAMVKAAKTKKTGEESNC